MRGVLAGLIFGSSILIAHEIHGAEARGPPARARDPARRRSRPCSGPRSALGALRCGSRSSATLQRARSAGRPERIVNSSGRSSWHVAGRRWNVRRESAIRSRCDQPRTERARRARRSAARGRICPGGRAGRSCERWQPARGVTRVSVPISEPATSSREASPKVRHLGASPGGTPAYAWRARPCPACRRERARPVARGLRSRRRAGRHRDERGRRPRARRVPDPRPQRRRRRSSSSSRPTTRSATAGSTGCGCSARACGPD